MLQRGDIDGGETEANTLFLGHTRHVAMERRISTPTCCDIDAGIVECEVGIRGAVLRGGAEIPELSRWAPWLTAWFYRNR